MNIMDEQSFSKEESLQLITKMINQAKNYYYESGLGCLLWGFTNVICFVLAYFRDTGKISLPFNPFLLMIITFILQVYYDRKENKLKKAVNYLDDVHKYVWSAFGISVLILTIVGGFTNIGYTVLPVLLILFGIPTFISGCISRFTPLVIGGIACWVLSILAFINKDQYSSYLLVAAGAGIAWIIPGFILRARFKKDVAQNQ
jgi:hypothetical protein